MGTFKVSRIVALLGSIISIIASFLPAIYTYVGGGTHRFSYVNFRWFWGFSYLIDYIKGGSLHYFGFRFDYFGIVSGMLLLIGGIIGIDIFNNLRKETMAPRKVGALLIIFGILSIIFITFWTVFWRIFETYEIKIVTNPFGVIFGYIGSTLITIAGISLLHSRREKIKKKRKIIEIIPMVGGITLLIAIITPTIIYGSLDYILIGFWYWGLVYVSEAGQFGSPILYYDIVFNLIGLITGILLVVGGIIGLGMGYNLKNKYMEPKKGGTLLILFGLLSLIFILIWIMFTPIGYMLIRYYILRNAVFLDVFIPLGVILGFIGNALIIIGGIHVLNSQRKDSKQI